MAIEIHIGNKNVTLTEFDGGKDKGKCYQITVRWLGKLEFARLTKKEMDDLVSAYLGWHGKNIIK